MIYPLKTTGRPSCDWCLVPHRRLNTSTCLHMHPPLKYNYIDQAEDLFVYQAGGYHPVAIGDRIHNQRYRVLVAIKIELASSTSNEVATLLAVQADSEGNGRGIPAVLDHFEITGPNGTHSCYVMVPAMCSLSGAKDAGKERVFSIDVARALSTQLLQAVACVHQRGFLPESFSHLSDQELYAEYGEPVLEAVTRSDGDHSPLPPGIPAQVVMPLWLARPSEGLSVNEAKLLLSDFGEAFAPSQERRLNHNAPAASRPPESRFAPEQPVSFAADIWMLACTIWQICGQKPLFEGAFATDDSMTRQQVEALGKLPASWWLKWETRDQFYTEDGTALSSYPRRMLSMRIQQHMVKPRAGRNMKCFDDDELQALEALLRAMLAFLPEDRPTITEVLESDLVKRWAPGRSDVHSRAL
ncbi:kinase-like protein [Dissoconium aciculare CBS 342.82]|uniref:non-specific serine/threonine protein kinase n=1 Tax=Dissoconium aciculare CBS 342.82 TaxID=1314786 RepID=A0A6J3LXW5_9PEZI|nr:kinase-like protein [Dissoconium aciculare CBS 342.82]KAF1820129.1 kinase-like protein [Dissoconium aciculare CBS 342.82]